MSNLGVEKESSETSSILENPAVSSSVMTVFSGFGDSFPNPFPAFLDFFFLADRIVEVDEEEVVNEEEEGDTNASDRIGNRNSIDKYFIV